MFATTTLTTDARWTDDDDLPVTPCQRDPETWFPETREQFETAMAGCAACPLRQPCERFARQHTWSGGAVVAGRRFGDKVKAASWVNGTTRWPITGRHAGSR